MAPVSFQSMISNLIFISFILINQVVAVPSCAGPTITIQPPAITGVSNLVSENFEAHPTQDAFIIGSGGGYLFTVPCQTTASATFLTTYNASRFTAGVKYNPADGYLYALFSTFPPKFNTTEQAAVGGMKNLNLFFF